MKIPKSKQFMRVAGLAGVATLWVTVFAVRRSPTPYTLVVPPGLPTPTLPPDNPLTVQGVALGERLFNEKRLSGNNTQACSSCHVPADSFSNGGVALSTGITGQLGTRNAMALYNLVYAPNFFWDGRAATIRAQALAPIQNPVEMDSNLSDVITKLNKDRTYVLQFEQAFGTPGINSTRIGLALEQYEITLMAGYSKFDLAQRGLATLTTQEQRGLDLFRTPYNPAAGKFGADCARCHGGPLFTDFKFRNNGLDSTPTDPGREDVTGLAKDFATFKTPSLRNLTVTGPYMHDGRFNTLEEVVAHYSSGIKKSSTLDPGLAREPGGVALSSSDQAALVAFLKTLADSAYNSNLIRP